MCASKNLHLFSVRVLGMSSMHDTQLARSSDREVGPEVGEQCHLFTRENKFLVFVSSPCMLCLLRRPGGVGVSAPAAEWLPQKPIEAASAY